MDVGKEREHDCMDAGGRAMQEQLPRSGSFHHIPVGYAGGRAMHGVIAENTKKKHKLRVLHAFVAS